jgi:hypothetical protein
VTIVTSRADGLFQRFDAIDKIGRVARQSVSFLHAKNEALVLKIAALVFGLIVAVMVAGPYFHFNPAIPIFFVLGFGVYMVGRIGGPLLPDDAHVGTGSNYGIYLDREDFVRPDPDSHSGGHLRDGVDPNDRQAR